MISIDELCREYSVDLEWDEDHWCYQLIHSNTEEQLTPCFMDYWQLERWVNDNFDDFSHKLTRREEGDAEEEDLYRTGTQ